MRTLSRLVLLILALLFGGLPALAQTTAWSVSEAKGVVTVSDAAGQRPAKVGTSLEAGAIVRTGAGASAVLVRGREFVTMRQNAQLRIAPAVRERGIVQIIQDYGSALFNIGKQPNPHFGVDTPYLAAVVKGTTFVITVNDEGASLQVTEGAVETATLDGGVRELIRPGAVAIIAAGDPLRMVVEGENRRVVDSPARAVVNADSDSASAPASPAAPASDPIATGSGPASGHIGVSDESAGTPPARVEQAIVSTPRDLSGVSNGFVSGEVSVLAAALVADNAVRANPPATGNSGESPATGGDTPSVGEGTAGAGGNAAGGAGPPPAGSGGGSEGNGADGVACVGGTCFQAPPVGNGAGPDIGVGSGLGSGTGAGMGAGSGSGSGTPPGGEAGGSGKGNAGSAGSNAGDNTGGATSPGGAAPGQGAGGSGGSGSGPGNANNSGSENGAGNGLGSNQNGSDNAAPGGANSGNGQGSNGNAGGNGNAGNSGGNGGGDGDAGNGGNGGNNGNGGGNGNAGNGSNAGNGNGNGNGNGYGGDGRGGGDRGGSGRGRLSYGVAAPLRLTLALPVMRS